MDKCSVSGSNSIWFWQLRVCMKYILTNNCFQRCSNWAINLNNFLIKIVTLPNTTTSRWKFVYRMRSHTNLNSNKNPRSTPIEQQLIQLIETTMKNHCKKPSLRSHWFISNSKWKQKEYNVRGFIKKNSRSIITMPIILPHGKRLFLFSKIEHYSIITGNNAYSKQIFPLVDNLNDPMQRNCCETNETNRVDYKFGFWVTSAW